MPTLEAIKSDRRLDQEGQAAFVLRTQERIAQMREKLARGMEPRTKDNPLQISAEAEQALIESEIARLDGELDMRSQGVSQGASQGTPMTPQPFQETTNALVLMMARLKEELAELTAKVKGMDGAVSEPQTPAHT